MLDPFAIVILDGCVIGPIVAVEGVTLVVNGSVVDASSFAGVAIAGREPGAAVCAPSPLLSTGWSVTAPPRAVTCVSPRPR